MSVGEIIKGSQKVEVSKKGGRADVQSLLVHTTMHPKGRIEIDPTTGLVKNPKNNVIFKKMVNVKVDNTVIGQREVSVNGGHGRKEGSVWRIALAGPSYYHEMVTGDDYRYTYFGKNDRTAPELTAEEFEEYQYFRVWANQENPELPMNRTKSVLSRIADVHDPVDKEFYTWLKKQDRSKIVLLPPTVFHPAAPAVLAVR